MRRRLLYAAAGLLLAGSLAGAWLVSGLGNLGAAPAAASRPVVLAAGSLALARARQRCDLAVLDRFVRAQEESFRETGSCQDQRLLAEALLERANFHTQHLGLAPGRVFYDQVPAGKVPELAFTISAESPGDRVAYFSRRKNEQCGLVPLHDRESKMNRWLKRHCTHFVELVIPRAAVPEVFRLRRG